MELMFTSNAVVPFVNMTASLDMANDASTVINFGW